MNAKNVISRLQGIDQDVQKLISDSGFKPDDWSWASVCPDPSDPNEIFLLDTAGELLFNLQGMHGTLQYLSRPVRGDHRLRPMQGGRYGYYDKDGDPCIFTCGAAVEALVPFPHKPGVSMWVRSRIEHDSQDYYLVGYDELCLAGLRIRTR